jgi:HAMP domain-containing protein
MCLLAESNFVNALIPLIGAGRKKVSSEVKNSSMTPEADQHNLYSLQTESRHLKEMIAALRDEMEKMRIGEQERLQQAIVSANDEIGQLKGMTNALRAELERRKIEYEEKCQDIEQIARDEANQLHEMIRIMRDRLEEHGER